MVVISCSSHRSNDRQKTKRCTVKNIINIINIIVLRNINAYISIIIKEKFVFRGKSL